MYSDLEHTLIGELDDVASDLVVPPLPDLPVAPTDRPRSDARGRLGRLAPFLAAAAVVVLAVGGATLGTSRDRDRDPGPATVPAPVPTRVPVPTEPALISYESDGSGPVEVRTAADADQLVGAPDSFKRFVVRTARRLAAGATCEGAYVGVTVRSLRTDGYAVGAVNECGGYVALWAVVDGRWKEIEGTQDLWDCAVLARYQVPSDIAGDNCYDAGARGQRPYRQD